MAGPALAVLAIGEIKRQMSEMVDSIKQKFTDLKSTILESVAAFRPFQVELFTRRMRDLQAVLGQMLLPIVQRATRYIAQFADYIYSLPASFKSAILSLAKVGVVLGVVVSVAGALAGAVSVLLKATSPIGWMIAAIGFLANSFRQTAGGARALQAALRFGEEAMAGLLAALQAVWDRLKPIRDRLSASLSELGDALADLFQNIKPLLSIGLVSAAALAVTALSTLVEGLRIVTDQMTRLTRVLNRLAKAAGFANLLPSTERKTLSSFNMAASGANITTDIPGVYRKIQEEILRNTGGKDDPAQQTAENTKAIAEKMDSVIEQLKTLPKNPFGQESLPTRTAIGKGAAFGYVGNKVLGMFRP